MIPDDKLLEEIRKVILEAIDWADKEGMTEAYLELHVKQTLSKVQEHYVRLADDQSLPENPTYSHTIHNQTQRDMWNAGFRRIEGGRK